MIHAVGPVWRGGDEGEDVDLASAVLAALRLADELGAKSIALPAISTGIFGFPAARAAEISIQVARSFAANSRVVERIVFCLFDDESLEVFRKELQKN